MTFKFNAQQLGKTVPASLIVFKLKNTNEDFLYYGIIGNQLVLDAHKIVEKTLEELFKVYNQYLIKNEINLFELLPLNYSTDEQEIYDAFCEVQHILFVK